MTILAKLTSATAISAVSLLALTAAAYAAGAPSVIAMNQKPASGQVSITYANLPKDGFLVIHSSLANGGVGDKVLGEVPLTAGDHRNIKVKLEGNPAAGTRLWAELQPGQGGKPLSKPFTDMGTPVEQSFKVL